MTTFTAPLPNPPSMNLRARLAYIYFFGDGNCNTGGWACAHTQDGCWIVTDESCDLTQASIYGLCEDQADLSSPAIIHELLQTGATGYVQSALALVSIGHFLQQVKDDSHADLSYRISVRMGIANWHSNALDGTKIECVHSCPRHLDQFQVSSGFNNPLRDIRPKKDVGTPHIFQKDVTQSSTKTL